MNKAITTTHSLRSSVHRYIVRPAWPLAAIVSALFILLFVYTGISKLQNWSTLSFVLKSYPLIGDYASLVATGLPVTELVVSALLFIPRTRRIGLWASLVLMSLFTVYLVYMLLFTPKLPCTCGGLLEKLSWPQHLLFNLFCILLALVGIANQPRSTGHDKNKPL